MFGMGYVINHCISLFQKEEEERLDKEFYKKSVMYIAQGIQFINHNTACIPALFKVESKGMVNYLDYIIEKPKDERTADKMIDDIMNACGLGG